MNFARLIASGLGLGYLPYAPGTFGACAGLLTIFLPSYAFIVLFILGFWACRTVVDFSQDPDPNWIVIDEILGVFFIIIVYRQFFEVHGLDLLMILCVFRFFDILKIWPINVFEKFCKKSKHLAIWGIMLDDMLASIYALITLYFVNIYFL